jgi:succinoglycan biosynthesis transport protein ExoP
MQPLEPTRRDPSLAVPAIPAVPPLLAAASLLPEPPKGMKRDYSGALEYWQMVRRHKGAVILTTILAGVVGFYTTLSEPRIYQAHTTIEIQSLNEDFLDLKSLNPNMTSDGGDTDTEIQTQVKILQSTTLIRRVTARMVPPPPSQPIPLPNRLSAWRKALGIAPPTQAELWQQALGNAAGSIRARSSGTTRIVDVTCDSTSRKLAADFLNALASEYIEQNLETRWKSTEHTGEWLTNQLHDLRVKLEKSQDELQNYANATHLVVTPEDKQTVDESRLGDLQKAASEAQTDRVLKQSRWEIASGSPPDALPAILDDTGLQQLQQQLTALKQNLSQLRITFTPAADDVRKVEAQISTVDAALQKQREDILRRIKNDYDSATLREKLLTDSYETQAHLVSGQTSEMDHYNFLKREVDSTRTIYESMLQKLKEASIASALRASNIRVVDAADIPGIPYKPDVPRSTFVGMLTGLCLGVMYAVSRERADRTIQDPGDAEFYLRMPELGVVPFGKLAETLRSHGADAGSEQRGVLPVAGLELATWNSRSSIVAESFRTALTSILFSGGDIVNQSRILVVTSASPKEGKSTVTCNLSIALAEVQSRVLLIDADMRRPRIHTVFGLENGRGLSDLLSRQEPLDWEQIEPLIVPTGIPGLSMLTSGKSRYKVASLLYSRRLPELLALLRTKFDSVTMDTPPMVNITDARLMGRHSDGVILVVRSSFTTRDAAILAKQRLTEDGSPLLGVILNGWNPNAPGYSYYRKYYYAGYSHYYAHATEDTEKPVK